MGSKCNDVFLTIKKVQCTEYVKDREDYFGHDWSPEKDNNFLDGKVNDVTHHQARYEEMMSILYKILSFV